MEADERHKLIIIGNGFDRAHGLATSYGEFIEHIIISHNKDRKKYNDLLQLNPQWVFRNIDDFKSRGERLERDGYFKYTSRLFKLLVDKFAENNYNWVDIEEFYFSLVYKVKNNIDSLRKLNSEFKIIKEYLEDYLYTIVKPESFSINEKLIELFLKGGPSHLYFLNFNYTETIHQYIDHIERFEKKYCSINFIHGEIKKVDNPIIFGYGNEDSRYRELLNLDNEFIKHIKSQEYSITNNYSSFIEYLHAHNNISVCIVGHSCGPSDRTLLNKIVEHSNVDNIEICYHESIDHYRTTYASLTKAFSSENFKTKIRSYPRSSHIPQIENDKH